MKNTFCGFLSSNVPDDDVRMTCPLIWHVGAENEAELTERISHIKAISPDTKVGLFRSVSTLVGPNGTVLDKLKCLSSVDFPTYLRKDAEGNPVPYNIEKDRWFANVDDWSYIYRNIIEAVVMVNRVGADYISWDNAYFGYPNYVSNVHMKEFFYIAKWIGRAYGVGNIYNVACRYVDIPDALDFYTDAEGVMLELCFYHKAGQARSLEKVKNETQAYLNCLDRGKMLCLWIGQASEPAEFNQSDLEFASAILEYEIDNFPNQLMLCKHGTWDNSEWYR